MSLFNKFSIEDIIFSSKEAYKNELKKGMGLQIGKSLDFLLKEWFKYLSIGCRGNQLAYVLLALAKVEL